MERCPGFRDLVEKLVLDIVDPMAEASSERRARSQGSAVGRRDEATESQNAPYGGDGDAVGAVRSNYHAREHVAEPPVGP